MRGRNTAVAIIASLFALETAHADPLTIGSGWAVMTMRDMMIALGFAKPSIDVKRYLDLSLVQAAAKRLS